MSNEQFSFIPQDVMLTLQNAYHGEIYRSAASSPRECVEYMKKHNISCSHNILVMICLHSDTAKKLANGLWGVSNVQRQIDSNANEKISAARGVADLRLMLEMSAPWAELHAKLREHYSVENCEPAVVIMSEGHVTLWDIDGNKLV